MLPKSFNSKEDSPRSGGLYKFLKLTKFRGVDYGRSKFREEAAKIEKINFPDGITMKKIFKVIEQPEPKPEEPPKKKSKKKKGKEEEEEPPAVPEEKDNRLLTAFGELVYMRATTKDFLV